MKEPSLASFVLEIDKVEGIFVTSLKVKPNKALARGGVLEYKKISYDILILC